MHECDRTYTYNILSYGDDASRLHRGGSKRNARERNIHIRNDWHILLALSLRLLNYNAINYYATYENPQRDD